MRFPRVQAVTIILAIALGACGSGTAGENKIGKSSNRAAAAPTESLAPRNSREEPTAGFSPEPIGEFVKWKAMRHVKRLAGRIGVRVRTTENERRGALYIADRFRSLGYRVNVQKFEVRNEGTSRNVVAWWPSAQRYPVVIGAHMDSVPGAPGANDNASGVAAVLEMARLVAGKRPAKFIRFVAFGSEEYGSNGAHHIGSTVFVNRLKDEGRKKLAGMVSVDMVADGRPLLVGNSGIAEDVVARTLYNKIRKAGISVSYRTLCDCSDNGPFEHAGIPASFMWSGDEPDYHSSSDTVENMRPEDLKRSGRALRAFVIALKPAMLERFRRNG